MARVTPNKKERDLLNSGPEGANLALNSMLKRFKRQVRSQGIMNEIRKRQYFKSKPEKRKEKQKISLIRQKKNIRN